MTNVIVLANESRNGVVFAAYAEQIGECIETAVKQAAQHIGPAKFAAAICERDRVAEQKLAA